MMGEFASLSLVFAFWNVLLKMRRAFEANKMRLGAKGANFKMFKLIKNIFIHVKKLFYHAKKFFHRDKNLFHHSLILFEDFSISLIIPKRNLNGSHIFVKGMKMENKMQFTNMTRKDLIAAICRLQNEVERLSTAFEKRYKHFGRKTLLTEEVLEQIEKYRMEGMSYKDISKKMGLSVGTVFKGAQFVM
jgi:hypothetical protein